MNRLFLFLLLIIMNSSCNESTTDLELALANTKTRYVTQKKALPYYGIDFTIEETSTNIYTLSVLLELDKGSYFVSPHSAGDYKGRFNLVIEDDDKNVLLNNELIELPHSKEGIDPWNGGPVSFVSENTTYQQQIKTLNNEDFHTTGTISFVIEPRCTLEKIDFTITRENGVIKVVRNQKGC